MCPSAWLLSSTEDIKAGEDVERLEALAARGDGKWGSSKQHGTASGNCMKPHHTEIPLPGMYQDSKARAGESCTLAIQSTVTVPKSLGKHPAS